MEKFGFGEALSFLDAGVKVCLELNGRRRIYSRQGNIITCNIEGSHVEYNISKFYIDAVLSEDWSIYE